MNNFPLISLFLFSYNQEKYIKQAVESALAQDYPNLEVVISDDHSTDDTVGIIRSIIQDYSGKHKVVLNINPTNLGIGEHVNLAFKMAKGEFIVFAAGDDISLPQRVSGVVDRWLELDKKVSAIYSDAKLIDQDGRDCGNLVVALSELKLIAYNLISYKPENGVHLLMGASGAYAKNLNNSFGGLLPNVNIEDIPLTIRASLSNGVSYIHEPLVLYRQNVSVWLPRKLENEGFSRHRNRMLYRLKTNYYVAKQIVHDVDCVNADQQTKRAAEDRFVATAFVQRCIEKECFLLLSFLRSLNKTTCWRYMLFPAIFAANPKIHRIIYKTYSLFKGS